eukprot:301649-Prymnesium_polylepis.1
MRLPAVRVVVYSTCSVYREENEGVVLGVLAAQAEFECVRAIPAWPHRGLEGIPELAHVAPLVCRATYDRDSTNGFFVARFERVGAGNGEGGAADAKKSKKEKAKTKEAKAKEAKEAKGKKRRAEAGADAVEQPAPKKAKAAEKALREAEAKAAEAQTAAE